MGNVRLLTGSQAAMLESIDGTMNLYLDKSSGEYLRYESSGKYEVVYSPVATPADPSYLKGLYDQKLISWDTASAYMPFVGKREDMVIADEVSAATDYTKQLNEMWSKQILYGCEKPTEAEKVARYNEKFPKKEKEMEIGGDKCHLCGAEKFYQMDELTVHKKYTAKAHHYGYACGTQIYDTYRVKPDGFVYKKDRHIHAECIG